MQQVLEKLTGPLTVPESMRAVRAVELLERLGADEARGVLRELAGGAAEARLTREAKAALESLSR